MTTLWDTTGTEVVKQLGAARNSGGSTTSGLALTFVVIADESDVESAEQAASTAAMMHPCRLLIVVRRDPLGDTPRLDAEVTIGGRLGPVEAVELRMHGRLSLHAESVVLPLLAPDAPVVTWWAGSPPVELATDGLGVLAGRRVTDLSAAADPIAALKARARDYAPGDSDLAWTRLTQWRSILSTAVDATGGAGRTVTVVGGEVFAESDSPSGRLLAGWLTSRLGASVRTSAPGREVDAAGISGVRLDLAHLPSIHVQRRSGLGIVSQRGRPDSTAALTERDIAELLGEELRRLDGDDVYGEALGAAAGVDGLSDRPGDRVLKWVDPAQRRGARKAAARAAAGQAAPKKSTSSGRVPVAGPAKKTAKKASAKNAATKKTAATTTTKAPATTSGSRKSTAKRTAATKTPAKKTPTKKTPATKTPAKTAAAKRSGAKRSGASATAARSRKT